MRSPSTPPPDFELNHLETFLLSDSVGEDAMTLSELDGYLTGIVIGPELIMPSEWIPLIWGSAPPDFASEKQAETIMSLIMGRYNQIIEDLTYNPDTHVPILAVDMDGSLLAEIWAEGFLDALGLRREAWQPILDTETGTALSLIMALAFPDMLEELADGEDPSDLANAISEDLSVSVVAIDQFWKSRRGVPSATIQSGPKIGRNAPCPCGSGKKYKKCCGLN